MARAVQVWHDERVMRATFPTAARSLHLFPSFVLVMGLVACSHVPLVPSAELEVLEKQGGHLVGETTGLEKLSVLDNKDFVYAVAISKQGHRAAFTHLGISGYDLSLWNISDARHPTLISTTTLNAHEFDVESVDFSPDGQHVATAGRDGIVRVFDANSGKTLGAYVSDEPLVVVRFHPRGDLLVIGSAKGLVTGVSTSGLEFVFESRLHRDEVRGLAFAADGAVFSGSWDKTLVRSAIEEVTDPVKEARLRFDRPSGQPLVRGMWVGKASLRFGFDNRLPAIAVTQKVADAAGVSQQLSLSGDTVTIPGPTGPQVARVVRGQVLALKSLRVGPVDVAICDACVPPGADGVFGQPFFEAFELATDESSGELVATPKPTPVLVPAAKPLAKTAKKSEPPSAPPRAPLLAANDVVPRPELRELSRFTFDSHLNDVVEAPGKHAEPLLAVAFSSTPAQRTREVYQREKDGKDAPVDAGNFAAVVNGASGKVERRIDSHLGVVSSAAVSPDGRTLASAGWDKRLQLNWFSRTGSSAKPVANEKFGWSVRRVRFSNDGRYVLVGAWTPQNAVGDQSSDDSAVLYGVGYRAPTVER